MEIYLIDNGARLTKIRRFVVRLSELLIFSLILILINKFSVEKKLTNFLQYNFLI